MQWYKLFLLSDFLDSGLVSRTYTYSFQGLGQKDVLATQGNLTAILFDDDIFIPLNFMDENPTYRDGYAGAVDDDGYVWLGIPEES